MENQHLESKEQHGQILSQPEAWRQWCRHTAEAELGFRVSFWLRNMQHRPAPFLPPHPPPPPLPPPPITLWPASVEDNAHSLQLLSVCRSVWLLVRLPTSPLHAHIFTHAQVTTTSLPPLSFSLSFIFHHNRPLSPFPTRPFRSFIDL